MGPVWFVSIAIVLFAALPNKIPFRSTLQTTIGLLVLAGVTVGAAYVEPVLGAACAIFLADLIMTAPVERFAVSEGFVASQYMAKSLTQSTTEPFATCGASGSTQRNGFAVSEGFEASNLSKDRVSKGWRWLDERTLGEDTRSIDTRTEDPTLTKDFVQGRHRWGDEEVLGENIEAIEERAVSDVPMYTRSGYSWHK